MADGGAAEAFRRRYGLERGGMPGPPMPAPPAPAPPAPEAPPPPPMAEGGVPGSPPGTIPGSTTAKANSNEVSSVTFVFRGVSLTAVSGQPEANKGIAYDVLRELQTCPQFDPAETKTTTDVTLDEQTGTFTFSIVAQLKPPLKL
jgi:hypothetical protein